MNYTIHSKTKVYLSDIKRKKINVMEKMKNDFFVNLHEN